jgi:polar amino acid transport system substrate-binding protein
VGGLKHRFLAGVVACCVALAAAGCGGDDDGPAAEPKGPLTTITPGVLTVGTELPAPTFWDGTDYRTVKKGFEAELAQELARRLGGLKVKVVRCPFVAINAGAPCDCDIDFSQIGITEARRRHWDFTIPYFDADHGVMVKTDTSVPNSDAVKNLQFGVQAETTAADFLENELKPTLEPKLYDTTVGMFDAFNTEEVQAILFDLPILLSAMTEGQVADAKIVGQFKTGERYGGILPKGSKNTDAVNRAMREMVDDGTVERLQQDYFGVATRNAAPFWQA